MRRIGSVLVLSLLVVLAACGSSSKSDAGSSGSSGGSTLSKADFIAQGDAICKAVDSKAPKEPSGTDAKSLSDYLGAALAPISEASTKFAALKAPSDATQLQKDFVADIDTAVTALKAAKAKADAGDVPGATSELQKTTPGKETTPKMAAYGFKDCADKGS
jgi:hypothetical protein